jgi:hypothetical protein
VSIPPCDIHLTELDVKQLLLVFTAGYVAPPVLTDIQLTDAFRRLFLRQSRTSARLQLVSERMVMSLATVIRAPSSTALSRTSCELLVLWTFTCHLMSFFSGFKAVTSVCVPSLSHVLNTT